MEYTSITGQNGLITNKTLYKIVQVKIWFHKITLLWAKKDYMQWASNQISEEISCKDWQIFHVVTAICKALTHSEL